MMPSKRCIKQRGSETLRETRFWIDKLGHISHLSIQYIRECRWKHRILVFLYQ